MHCPVVPAYLHKLAISKNRTTETASIDKNPISLLLFPAAEFVSLQYHGTYGRCPGSTHLGDIKHSAELALGET